MYKIYITYINILYIYAKSSSVVFTFTQQNRDEGKCPQNGVKWKDLMTTLILDRLETSFGNCRNDELPQTMARTTQNMINNCDECQQCNTSGGESSSTKYFDSAWNDDTCHQHSTTDHDSVVQNTYIIFIFKYLKSKYYNIDINSCRNHIFPTTNEIILYIYIRI